MLCGSCALLGQEERKVKNGTDIRAYDDSMPLTTEAKFGCVHYSAHQLQGAKWIDTGE